MLGDAEMLGVMTHLEKRLDFCVKSPPLPISELQIGSAVSLKDSDGIQLLHTLLIVPKIVLKILKWLNYFSGN